MKKFIIVLFMFSTFSKISASENESAYNYEFVGIDGNIIKLSDYKNKAIVIVNVASRCGYTSQYEDLQLLWSTYKSKNGIRKNLHLLVRYDLTLLQCAASGGSPSSSLPSLGYVAWLRLGQQ